MTDDFLTACVSALSIRPPALPEVDALVERFCAMPGNASGGALHIVLDDANLDNDSIWMCIDQARASGNTDAAALGLVILAVPLAQRCELGFACLCGCSTPH